MFEAFKSAPPVSPGVSPSSPQEPENASLEAPQEEQYYTSVTPSGIEVAYSPAPRRHYRLRHHPDCIKEPWFSNYQGAFEWREVPSVTTVLGVLDKSGPLVWWAQGQACEGIMELVERGRLETEAGTRSLLHTGGSAATKESLVDLLTSERLSVNHKRDSAADRGVNVHGALEAWVESRRIPSASLWDEPERGYISGLCDFLGAVNSAAEDVTAELMVGSLEHSYAGRFDLVLTLSKPVDVVTRCYPKRPPKIESIPAGRWLIDLKTRAKPNVYPSNYMQLEAYELASVECGYEPTDYRAVLVVTPDGKYQLSVNHDWTADDFLAVRKTFQVMNERGVVQALRDELDAKEVA